MRIISAVPSTAGRICSPDTGFILRLRNTISARRSLVEAPWYQSIAVWSLCQIFPQGELGRTKKLEKKACRHHLPFNEVLRWLFVAVSHTKSMKASYSHRDKTFSFDRRISFRREGHR